MGALVTLDLPADSPVLAMPWIITFGPLSDDDEWEPVVCGPYERPHALALAEAVVADEELMAVVEPLLPHVQAEEIRGEIAAAQLAAIEERDALAEEIAAEAELAGIGELGDEPDRRVPFRDEPGLPGPPGEMPSPPTVEEIRAGFARIAARLANSGTR